MVFTKPLNLAPLAKTFTHGYARSLVAGAQSSYASQTSGFGTFGSNFVGRLGKGGHKEVQNAFQQPTQDIRPINKPGYAEGSQDQGLAAYYAAWQKHQKAEDREWHQFQFAKRIGWKAPTTVPEGQGLTAEVAEAEDAVASPLPRRALERSYTTSTVDDFNKAKLENSSEALAVAQVDQAIAQEIEKVKEHTDAVTAAAAVESAQRHSPTVASHTVFGNTDAQGVSSATPTQEAETYASHLTQLADEHRYAEIPALFESMLNAGINPTATAYNALLRAATHLPRSLHQVIPKALDVYSDLLRRRVSPDTTTYSILIQLLSTRAIKVHESKKALQENRARLELNLFPSNNVEQIILAEDDSLVTALKIFESATMDGVNRAFSADVYGSLIVACAKEGRLEDMVRVYIEMENRGVIPSGGIFPPMILAFAHSGNLAGAVDLYQDGYRALAVANEKGENAMVRQDPQVYSAIVRAYNICNRTAGGEKFLARIHQSLQELSAEPQYVSAIDGAVVADSLVPSIVAQGSFAEALEAVRDDIDPSAWMRAMSRVCISAADSGQADVASKAFDRLAGKSAADLSKPAIAMFAMHLRGHNLTAAVRYTTILQDLKPSLRFIEPATLHTRAMISMEQAEAGLGYFRKMMWQIRESRTQDSRIEAVEQIDEALHVLAGNLLENGTALPINAAMELLWTMAENEKIVVPLVETLLATIGSEDVLRLRGSDSVLVLQAQADLIARGSIVDTSHVSRFYHLLNVVTATGTPVNEVTAQNIEQVISLFPRPDLAQRRTHLVSPTTTSVSPDYQSSIPSASFEENFDPYGATLDYKGSTMIVNVLEKPSGRHSARLHEALDRFRNMRRIGRHATYQTYAKLITAAAKESNVTMMNDIFAHAKVDVPYIPHNRVVHLGWVSIMDSMVSACLTTGRRDLADRYHNDLLSINAAPSANTFGLYITTLKENTKTYDEASEAVQIFHRAKEEGVTPTSFLYNALVGKLGKARRIDDCMLYFNEMKTAGIRPTSVTYGTIVNALCRVSSDALAEEMFEEMEEMPNYKARPAPYNSLMQYFLMTKSDRAKVLSYYERMRSKGIDPTSHTYKLLIETHATLQPIDIKAAEGVLRDMRASGHQPEAVHYAALIHAHGCNLRSTAEARALFDTVIANPSIKPQPCLWQALIEGLVANQQVSQAEELLPLMREKGVQMTPYVANSLIRGWSQAGNVDKAENIFLSLGLQRREPSTYDIMTKAFIAADKRQAAEAVVAEALSRGYPAAVQGKIAELVRW